MKASTLIFSAALLLSAYLLAMVGCDHNRSTTNANDSSRASEEETSGPSPPVASDAQPTAQTPDRYDFSALDKLLEEAAPRLGGCALVLVKDGQVIYRKSVGRHSAEKVVPVASASKWLSGALLMSLVDEGKLRLDDQVSKYLPEFTGDKAAITIRQLFSHTAGLPPEAVCRNDKRTTLEACAKEMAQLKLRSTPGAEFYYGGVSMHIAGRVCEIVSGKSWNELFIERIAAPLGMMNTDFFAYGQTMNPRPAGDARSNADDFARFLQMILDNGNFQGRQILSAASIEEMHKDQTGGARIAYTIYEKHGDLDPALPRARYGIGVWRERVDEASGGLLEASSQGALGFSPWIDAERNLGGVFSAHSSMSRVMPLYLALKREIRRIVPARSARKA